MRIIGIDPGSRITGFGVIDTTNNSFRYVVSGCIKATEDNFAKRLQRIYQDLTEVVEQYRPQQAAIEQIFMHRNAQSALKLGQARGAAIASLVHYHLDIFEYTPREVKLATVGTGGADKTQVQHMVAKMLGLQGLPQADAADALAIAVCHSNTQRGKENFAKMQQL